MFFGSGKALITPVNPVKMACTGDFQSVFTDVHDDLYCRTLIVDDGSCRMLLMSCDLLFHSRDLNDAVADYAQEHYGVRKDAVVISCTHAHTAPAAKNYNLETADERYESYLISQAKLSVDRAAANMQKGRMEYGYAAADHAVSRRLIRDGHAEFAPSFENVRDKDAAVLAFYSESNELRALALEYGCHPVHYPARTSLSAEYPGRICALLEARHYGCDALFVQGAGASSRPKLSVGPDGEFRSQCSFGDIDRMASAIADSVTVLIGSGRMKKTDITISFAAETVCLPVEPMPRRYFKDAESGYEKLAPRARMVYEQYDRLPSEVSLVCGLVRLGPELLLAHMGGEPCYEVYELLQKALDRDLFFAGYTDDIAYIVTDEQLRQGGYETDCFIEYRLKGRFREGLDEKIIGAYRRMLRKIEKREGGKPDEKQ